jgi:hypothetical protein
MAVTQTTRLGVYRWSSNDDEFTRSQMDDSHQGLEALVALFTSDTFANRPAAAASNARGFFLATDTNVLYYSNGTAWFSVNSFASPVALLPGDSITDGTSTFAARADHKHSLPAFGVVGDIEATSTTASAGTDVLFARADHRHTIGAASVVSGSLAANSISAANLFTAQVVERAAIKDGAVNAAKLDAEARIPAGTIWAYGGTSAPAGWLFCNGASYAVSAQNDLYNAIGYQYGGSGLNFNVPDLLDRIPRGSANTGYGLGVNAGSDTATLGMTNIPSHAHSSGTIAVTAHGQHSHGSSFYADAWYGGNHDHSYNHSHGGYLLNGGVGSGGTFGLFYVPQGDGPYSAFFGGEGPQLDLTGASVSNGTITTNSQSANITSAANLNHGHSVSGGVSNSTADWTHTVSGSTGTAGQVSPTAVTVTPKTQTVNYIIKT